MARIKTIISASKVHRNTHRMHNLKHGLLEPIPLIYLHLSVYFKNQPHHVYKKSEELHKTRAIEGSKQGEYPELHHVSTTKGHADCHHAKT